MGKSRKEIDIEGSNQAGKTTLVNYLLMLLPNSIAIKTPPDSLREKRKKIHEQLEAGEVSPDHVTGFYLDSVVEAYNSAAPANGEAGGDNYLLIDRGIYSTIVGDICRKFNPLGNDMNARGLEEQIINSYKKALQYLGSRGIRLPDKTVLLLCDNPCKRNERLSGIKMPSSNDKKEANMYNFIIGIYDVLVRQDPERWIVVDTSDLTPSDIADRVLNYLSKDNKL